ncbi:MAG: DUF1636 domain-containing protein [Pseudomonadota bacterium]
MPDDLPILSICLTCRDGREEDHGQIRGGTRLAEAIAMRSQDPALNLRGVQCMSQCKRPCVAALSGRGRFSYLFGDLDPTEPVHVEALLQIPSLYMAAPEGFLTRDARPAPLQASILGRLPPVDTASTLVMPLRRATAA